MLSHRCTSPDQLKQRIATFKRDPLPSPSRDVELDATASLGDPTVNPPVLDASNSIALPPAASSIQNPEPPTENPSDPSPCDNPALTDSRSAARGDHLRDEEWAIGIALLRASRLRLRCLLSGTAPKSALAEAARFADLGSRLARRSITAATVSDQEDPANSTASGRFLADYEASINQIVEAHKAAKKAEANGAAAAAADGETKPVPTPAPNQASA